jgi:A nuclease family of the HNH/ENDO VII superfamily with conserved AHH
LVASVVGTRFSSYAFDESGAAIFSDAQSREKQSQSENAAAALGPLANSFSTALDSADQRYTTHFDESGNGQPSYNGSGNGHDESGGGNSSAYTPANSHHWWEQAQAVAWAPPSPADSGALQAQALLEPAPAYNSWSESDPFQNQSQSQNQGFSNSNGGSDESGYLYGGASFLPVGGASVVGAPAEPAVPTGPTASAQELAGMDQYLNSAMNQVLIREFGQGPVAPASSNVALEQVRRYGQERYEKLERLEQALAHIQGDYARAREQAKADPNSVGWVDAQVKVVVGGGLSDESGGWIVPPVYADQTVRQFSPQAFSDWYNSQLSVSNLAFGQLYGTEQYTRVPNPYATEFGPAEDLFESQFIIQNGTSNPQTLVLRDGRMEQQDWVRLDLNGAPELNNDSAVSWDPRVGFVTHNSNIHEDTDWFEVAVQVIIIAVVAYVSAGTLGAAAASAVGGGFAGAVAAGAVVGATTAVASGAMNGNLTWEGILKGALLGGIGGGLSFGIGELAQSTASNQFATEAMNSGGTVTPMTDGGVTGGGNYQTSFDVTRGPVIEFSDQVLQQQAFEQAQQTFNGIRTAGNVVQGGILSAASGGDFEDGAFTALGSTIGQAFGGGVSDAVSQSAQGSLSPGATQFIGSVAGAAVSSQIVNARGGDGDQAFINSVVNSAVTVAASQQGNPSQTEALSSDDKSATIVGTVFDDDGNLMPGVVDSSASWNDRLDTIRLALIRQGMDDQNASSATQAYSDRLQSPGQTAISVSSTEPISRTGNSKFDDVKATFQWTGSQTNEASVRALAATPIEGGTRFYYSDRYLDVANGTNVATSVMQPIAGDLSVPVLPGAIAAMQQRVSYLSANGSESNMAELNSLQTYLQARDAAVSAGTIASEYTRSLSGETRMTVGVNSALIRDALGGIKLVDSGRALSAGESLIAGPGAVLIGASDTSAMVVLPAGTSANVQAAAANLGMLAAGVARSGVNSLAIPFAEEAAVSANALARGVVSLSRLVGPTAVIGALTYISETGGGTIVESLAANARFVRQGDMSTGTLEIRELDARSNPVWVARGNDLTATQARQLVNGSSFTALTPEELRALNGPLVGPSITPQPPTSSPPLVAMPEDTQRGTDGYQGTDPAGPLILIYPEAEPMTYEDYVIYKNNGKILGDNLSRGVPGIRAPEPKPGEGYEPHHMIPSGDKRGAELQERLREVGIDINEAVNGVWLPKNSDVPNNGETPHNETFRDSYFDELDRRFENANTRAEFEDRLNTLHNDLKNRQIKLPTAGGK